MNRNLRLLLCSALLAPLLAVAAFAGVSALAQDRPDSPLVHPTTGALPFAAITWEYRPKETEMVLAFWEDGSAAVDVGKEELHRFSLDPEAVEALKADLAAILTPEIRTLLRRRSHTMPHASHNRIHIGLKEVGGEVTLESYHPLYEDDHNVQTDDGLQLVENETERAEAVASRNDELTLFRNVWEAIFNRMQREFILSKLREKE